MAVYRTFRGRKIITPDTWPHTQWAEVLDKHAEFAERITAKEEQLEAFARRWYIRNGGQYADKIDFYCVHDRDGSFVKMYFHRQFIARVKIETITSETNVPYWEVADSIGDEDKLYMWPTKKEEVWQIDKLVAAGLTETKNNEARKDIGGGQ